MEKTRQNSNRQGCRERLTLLLICAILVLAAFCAGRFAREDPQKCITCLSWDVSEIAYRAEESRCPEGPVQWRDVFKSPQAGGFTVSVPEGSWRINWEQQ